MAEKVPLGGRGEYPSARLPSTTSTEKTTTSYPTSKCTPMPHSPKGEGLSQSERQFRQPSYRAEKEQGAPLDRAVERQYANGRDADGSSRFGTIGSGAEYGTEKERKGQWGRDGKSHSSTRVSREDFADNDLDSRYGRGGLGKSG